MEAKHVMIALFDVLGFSERVNNGKLDQILDLYTHLIQVTTNPTSLDYPMYVSTDGRRSRVPIVYSQQMYTTYFSDTFVLWADYNVPGLPLFLHTCIDIFCTALESKIPLRGCVSIGDAVMEIEPNVFVGIPIVEAARGESAQNWIGLSFGNSFIDVMCTMPQVFIPYNKHIKKGKEEAVLPFAADWPQFWKFNRTADAVSLLSAMNDKSEFSGYYDNTIDFINFSNRNKTWWKMLNMGPLQGKGKSLLLYEVNKWIDSRN